MLNFLAIINLIIAVQSFFLAAHFILKSKGIKLLNRLLTILCLAFALITLNTYFFLSESNLYNSLLQNIANNSMWFIGPVLYFFVIYHEKKAEYRFILMNTLPFIILALIDIIFEWSWYTNVIPFVAFIQITSYLSLCIAYCVRQYKKNTQFYNWILPAIIAFSVILLVNFTLTITQSFNLQILPKPIINSFTTVLIIPVFFIAYKEMNTTNSFNLTPKKYSTTKIPKEKAIEYLKKIKRVISEDKLHLNKDLNLQSFSKHINIPSKYVSQVINQHLNLSFSDYILQHRLTEVKKKLVDKNNEHLTIFGIAQDSGFSSSSRFNHLFKKHIGKTPKQFQQSNK